MSCCGPSESYVLDREIDMCMDSLYEIQVSERKRRKGLRDSPLTQPPPCYLFYHSNP